jgi:hypothetical protein
VSKVNYDMGVLAGLSLLAIQRIIRECWAAKKRQPNLRVSLIFLICCSFFSVPVTSFAKEPPVLTLSSEGRNSEGSNPKYKFKIYEDGLVLYHGDIKVKAIGNRQAKITRSQVLELIETFMKIDNVFQKYERETGQKLTTGHNNQYTFRLQYQGKILENNVGGFTSYMFINLNKMTLIENWICFDFNDPLKPEYDNCPFRFFPATPLN